MSLNELPGPVQVLVGLDVSSKKQFIEQLAAFASTYTGLPQRALLESIMRRERLGSTTIGHGIALPHIACAGLDKTVTILATSKSSVDFSADDNQLVDIVCLVIGLEHADFDHLKFLSYMEKLLRSEAVRQQLRQASSPEDALLILQAPKASAA